MGDLARDPLLDGGQSHPQPQATDQNQDTMSTSNEVRINTMDLEISFNTISDSQAVEYNENDQDYRSADEEDMRLVVKEPSKPRKISQKKKIEQINFTKWVNNNRQSLAKKSAAQSSNQEQTLTYMVKSWEGGQKIISSPRDYQLELFERAKKENTVAVLDTGSGKTLIAVLLLEHTIAQELQDRKTGKPRRISFFLVDKVALAFQQHAVLDVNLPYPVKVFSGDSVRYSWTKEFWAKEFKDNEVIVCTAEILNQCLQYAYIRIDQISLLIFDEAHHAKKKHPYAVIVKEYYIPGKQQGLRLPRIFGMTASPVDTQGIDVRKATLELEGLLDSRIATTADPDALRRTVGKPKNEQIALFDPLRPKVKTHLTFKLGPLVGNNKLFAKAFAFADTASRELGPWFVDRMWQLFLDDEEIMKLAGRTERKLSKEMATTEVISLQRDSIQAARRLIEANEFQQPAGNEISSKVDMLKNLLKDSFKDPSIRCIVFVETRWTAILLTDFFRREDTNIPGLKVASLMGANQQDISTQTSFRAQIRTIISFKRGDINCIFATSVAEEGLDIPDCNLIIRFDLCKTMIQYIQSRGRARQANSTYIHLSEKGNHTQRRSILQNTESEKILRQFCEQQPEDRKLKGSDYDMDHFLKNEKKQRQYTIKATGAKLTYKNSLSILQDFLNSLRNSDSYTEGMSHNAEFSTTPSQGGFVSEVMMPLISPISTGIGKVYSTKQVAKCSAAFEICLKLLERKFLDANLRSTFTERRHIMANARLAVTSKKKTKYDMRMKPSMWSQVGIPDKLYVTVVTLSKPTALGRPSRPLLILTRATLPQFKVFPLYIGYEALGMVSDCFCQVLNHPIHPRDEDLEILTKFTLKIFIDLFNKRYSATAGDMPYFFAPTTKAHDFEYTSGLNAYELIDWNLLSYVFHNDAEMYTGDEPDEFFTNKYVVDPFDGSRRFWLTGVCRELSIDSPVPEAVEHQPTYSQWKRGEVAHTIINWSVTAWRATREAKERSWNGKQPVAVGCFASLRRNFLADLHELKKNPLCFFALEPMRISPLPADFVSMATLIPSIIYRIEQHLIALDACKVLQLDIEPNLALEALTKDSDNQGEDEGRESLEAFEPINFQPGMGDNYERLELLGDSFLKMATTISVFTLIPNKDEFDYHCERMVMICNQNLFGVALSDDLKLQEYVRSKSLERGSWYPILKLEFGKMHMKTLKQMDEHSLGDKTIADVCEALMGAAYMTGRKNNNYDLAIQAVTRLVNNKRHTMKEWGDYYAAYKIPDWQALPTNAVEEDMAARIHEITGYKFKYPRVLRSAFRHPSRPYTFDKVPTYQRLEFLGDALFDMVCVDYLYHIAPDKGPQWLTEHKMAMVSNQFLGCLAVSLGFHRHILLNHGSLGCQIQEYVTDITMAREAAEDAAEAAGKARSEYARDYWVEVRSPPKCIPDVLEAFIGAIFVDSGYDFSRVQLFWNQFVRPYFSNMLTYDTFANKHPVTLATQFIYATFGCHAYGLHAEEMPVTDDIGVLTGHNKVVAAILIHGQVVDGAVRESGRYAKTAAARKALNKLKEMTRQKFIEAYDCDCRPHEGFVDIAESATAI